MPYRVRPVRDLEEFKVAVAAIGHYFGWQPTDEEAERFGKLLPLERMLAVFDDGRIVAGAGALQRELTLPGRAGACAGVDGGRRAAVASRRGLLRRMMEAQLRDVRERGEPVAALWASEETISSRFGYGLAAYALHVEAERSACGFAPPAARGGSIG